MKIFSMAVSTPIIVLYAQICVAQVQIPEYGSKDFAVFSQEDDIVQAVCECYQHPFGGKDVAPFRYPIAEVKRLLERFGNSTVDPKPDVEMVEICTVRLVTADGRSQRISVFWLNAKDPALCFSLNGIRCICHHETKSKDGKLLDHALIFDGKLRKANDRQKKVK